jgi:hypothetical protein
MNAEAVRGSAAEAEQQASPSMCMGLSAIGFCARQARRWTVFFFKGGGFVCVPTCGRCDPFRKMEYTPGLRDLVAEPGSCTVWEVKRGIFGGLRTRLAVESWGL